MTKREFYTAIVRNTEISADLVEFARHELDAMDSKLASAKSKKVQADTPILDAITAMLDGGATLIASEVGKSLDISTSKASAMLRKLVESGVCVDCEVKVDKRKVKGYKRA